MTIDSGIYQIKNLLDNKIYIGSSSELKRRKQLHFSGLRCNEHPNRYLQFAWNKYGGENFIFEIIFICHPKILLFYEQQFLNQLKPEYNILTIAGSPRGYKHTEETKRKISRALKGRTVSDRVREKCGNLNRGKRLSKEHREKLSLAHRNRPHKLVNIDFMSLKGNIVNVTYIKEFCDKYSLDASHISAVILGKRKSHKGWKIWQP